MSYDPTLFIRADSDFGLYERFKQLCHRFWHDAFKTPMQLVSTGVLLRCIPTPFIYFPLVFYLLISCTLVFLMVLHLFGLKNERYKNFDVTDAIDFQWEHYKNYWRMMLGLFLLWNAVYWSFYYISGSLSSKPSV